MIGLHFKLCSFSMTMQLEPSKKMLFALNSNVSCRVIALSSYAGTKALNQTIFKELGTKKT